MKQPEMGLEDIPLPGEPLQRSSHPDNEKAQAEWFAERKSILGGRLPRNEIYKLKRRYKILWKSLNRVKYNDLVSRRWDCYQDWQRLKYEIKSAPPGKAGLLKLQALSVRNQGEKLNEIIRPVKHLAEEFENIIDRLKAHKDSFEFEREERENRAAFRREHVVWEQQIKAVFKQSARLHHKGEDKKGNPFIKTPKIEHIFFKDDRVYFQVKLTSQTLIERLLNRWHSALPYDVDIADLTCQETLDNLSAACNRVVTVERSKRGTNLFYVISRLDSPDGIPKKVLYSKVIQWYPSKQHVMTPWAAGVTQDRKAVWFNFEDHPHILIAGSTKSGKSNHVNQIIATLVTMNRPDEIRIQLVDMKGGIEFTHWQGTRHELKPMVKNASDVLPALKYIRGIMERRLATFESIKAKNLSSYNGKVKVKLPRIIMIVDEMATLLGLGELTTEIHNELRVLSSQGRAVGVHLILCTQHSSVDVLPGWVKTNMGVRISGKMPSISASQVILDSVTAATLPPVPGRLVFSIGREETIAQSPYISDEEIAIALKESKNYPAPDNSEFTNAEVNVPKPKFSRDDLLEFALNKFDGKLTANRIHNEVGNEIISLRDMRWMVEDVLEESLQSKLEHRGIRYTVVRVGRAYVLKPIGETMERESDNNLRNDDSLHHSVVTSELDAS